MVLLGKPQEEKSFPTLESNYYPGKLISVKASEGVSFETRNKPENEKVFVDKLEWTFETTKEMRPDDGKPFQFKKWTGTEYGYEKAGLTILIDGQCGRHFTADEYAQIDLEKLQGRFFRLNVEEYNSEDGNPRNRLLSVIPPKKGATLTLADLKADPKDLPQGAADGDTAQSALPDMDDLFDEE